MDFFRTNKILHDNDLDSYTNYNFTFVSNEFIRNSENDYQGKALVSILGAMFILYNKNKCMSGPKS